MCIFFAISFRGRITIIFSQPCLAQNIVNSKFYVDYFTDYKFKVGTLNVNSLRGRVCEVVETLSPRKVDVCCIQETRYRGGNCRIIKGTDTRYKLYWSGNDKSTAGGVFVAEEWIEKVFEVQRVSDRIILVKLVVGQRVVTLLSV